MRIKISLVMAVHGNELAPFVLRRVADLESGDAKGSGAYGAVYEVTVNDIRCIAKRIHDILVNQQVSSRERGSIQEKFRQECVLLSKLRHPNIVHFVGVHYGKVPGDLTLVMERLHTDLGKFLDSSPAQIPLSVKLAILLDVSYGLLYLHTHSPPIIHRDLTANNVLLTKDLRAKIADLGVSKLLDLQRQAKTHTKAPGSWFYMPPEALKEKSVYDISLDAFSFGHLSLYTANQDFPNVYEVTITPLVLQQQTVQILKRSKAIDRMGSDHCLYPVIVACLQDLPAKRPTTAELSKTLKELTEKHPKSLDDVMKASGEQDRLAVLAKEKEDLWNELEAVKAEAVIIKEDFMAERRDRAQAAQHYDDERTRYELELYRLKEELTRQSDTAHLHDDVRAKTEQYKKEMDMYKGQIEGLKAELGVYQQQLAHSQQQRDSLAAQLQQLKGRKNSESEFATAFQNEFEKRNELERKYTELREHYDRLFLDNDRLKKILQQHNIPRPPPPLPPQSSATDASSAGLPMRSLSLSETPLEHHLPQHDMYMKHPWIKSQSVDESQSQDHAPIPRAHLPRPQLLQEPSQPLQGRPNVAFPRSNKTPFLRQAPHGGTPTVMPRQAMNVGVGGAEKRLSSLTQGTTPSQPQKHAGLMQRSRDLMQGLQDDTHVAAAAVLAATEQDNSLSSDVPYDPNLICPYCNKNFRIGQIQQFRRHVGKCTGT